MLREACGPVVVVGCSQQLGIAALSSERCGSNTGSWSGGLGQCPKRGLKASLGVGVRGFGCTPRAVVVTKGASEECQVSICYR